MKINNVIGVLSLLWFGVTTGFAQSDDCSSAPQLTPNLTQCVYQSGSSGGATQSLPGCSGNADDDVWFYFIANSTEMTVKVDPTVGYDAVFEVFAGSCGGTSLGCRDINPSGIDEKYTYTGLTIGNAYYVRIYHYGVGYGSATFRICVSGLSPTINVNPCSAYVLPDVEPACNFLTYAISNHTGSGITTPSSCGGSAPQQGGYAGGDMWFKVVVPSSGKLEISTLPIDINDGAMALYSSSAPLGACSGTLTQVACNDDRSPANNKYMPYIYSTGNTPGDTMYIRVWDYNNNTSGKFKMCVSTPDNDHCPTALQICDLNGYGGTTSPQYDADRPDNMRGKDESPAGGVFGIGYTGASPVQIDNNSWITFQAASTTASFTVDIEDCLYSNRGLQMQIFEGAGCASFVPVSNFLETQTSQVLNATGLTVGNTYYIVVDGFAGDVCSYTITANTGVQVVTVTASDTNICEGSSVTLNAQVFGTGSYTYSWYSIPAGGPYPASATFTDNPTVTTEYFVNVTGLCGEVTTSSFKVYVNPIPTAPVVSASASPICPNGTSTINASGTPGASYAVYNAPTGGTLLGYTPYVFSPAGTQGTTTFYVEAISPDSCVSTSRSSVSVVSLDNTGPSLSCPSNQVVYVDANCQHILNNYLPLVTATDNCFSAVTNITQSPVAGTLLSGHNTNQVVTITAVDSLGNSSTCTFVVNLQDNINPVMTCLNDTTVYADSACQYTIPDFVPNVSTTDNCTAPNNIIYTQTPVAGTVISGAGTVQTVRIIATDGANNKDTCEFDITLDDAMAPELTCPSDQYDTLIQAGCQYVVEDYTIWPGIGNDNCSASSAGLISQNPLPGTVIDLAALDQIVPITITYDDGNGNTSQCNFNVHAACIRDIEVPEFFTPNNDGHNDMFVIKHLPQVFPTNKLRLFNRWGELIYEMDNYQNDWVGKANAGMMRMGSDYLPDGTYFYVLELQDAETKTGFVHMRR